MRLFFVVFQIIVVLLVNSSASVVFTELMRNPYGSSKDCPGDACLEFVEFTNFGLTRLNLNNLLLTSGNHTDSIVHWDIPFTDSAIFDADYANPGQSVVILDKDYSTVPDEYKYKFAKGTIFLTVNHVSILGGLTSTRGLMLYSGTTKNVYDTLALATQDRSADVLELPQPSGMIEGHSLVPKSILFYSNNFIMSDTVSLGWYEPVNESFLIEYNIEELPVDTSNVICKIKIFNINEQFLKNAKWQITTKNNDNIIKDSLINEDNFFVTITTKLPANLGELEFRFQQGNYTYNMPIKLSAKLESSTGIKINEIFPRSNSDIQEWIEITNVSNSPINLLNWRFGPKDNPDTISYTYLTINSGNFKILTKDKNKFLKVFPYCSDVFQPNHWPALSDYSDTLCLWNPTDSIPVETVYYNSKWFDSRKYASLERVSLKNNAVDNNSWVLSATPTPGMPNKSVWRNVNTAQLHIGPIPFTPNGDDVDDMLSIKLKIPASYSGTVSIYSFSGYKIFELPQPIKNEYLWNGISQFGQPAPIGPFFIIAEFKENNSTIILRSRGILWR